MEEVQAVRDVAYGPHRLHRYDVFAPRGARNAPVLVFWHGGGWTNGYRQHQTFMAPHVAALGMILVSPSYRLAPEHPLPCAHEDSLLLLSELQRRLPEWGGVRDQSTSPAPRLARTWPRWPRCAVPTAPPPASTHG